MKDYTLITYGAYNLTSPNIFTSDDNGDGSANIDVARVRNSKNAGSTVVDSQLNEKNISLSTTVVSDDYREMIDVYNELQQTLEEKGRYLRFIRTWDLITPMQTDTDWIASGDTVNRAYDTENRVFSGSISFDADVSVSSDDLVSIYNTSLDGINLATRANQGDFECFVYIPDNTNVTSVVLRVGSSVSGYYSHTFTTQVDGTAIQNGWNLFGEAWGNFSETGVIDISQVGSFTQVIVNYSSSQTDLTGFRLGGVLWELDSQTTNYKVFPTAITKDSNRGNNTYRELELQFVNYTGYGESSAYDTAYSGSALTGTSNDADIQLYGSFEPMPVLTYTFSSITNMKEIVLTNNTNGDVVTIASGDTAWSANDVIIIDLEGQKVTKNGNNHDFSDVLPRFRLGLNKLNFGLTATNESTITQDTYTLDLKGEI
jgi:phage-related protein